MFRALTILAGGIVLVSPVAVLAQGVITSGNATWEYNNDPGTPGSSNLEPDGAGALDDNITQNWWWFRIDQGPGFSIFETPLSWPPTNQSYIGDTATLSDSEASFDWELTVTIADDPMIGNATVTEALTIQNTTLSDITVTIFNFADFAVAADELDDTSVVLDPPPAPIVLGFVDDDPLYSAELQAPNGSGGFEINDAALLLGALNDSTTFNPSGDPAPMGPGNLAGVVEYERTISPGGMATLDELLKVNFLPEPASVTLLMLGAVGVLRCRRVHEMRA